jgi:hypothetical protein
MQRLAIVLIGAVLVAGCGFDARVTVHDDQAAQDALLASDAPARPGGALPEGHPPLRQGGRALPPGHPAILPPGHPPIPAGECPAGGMRGFGPMPSDASSEPEIVST